MEDIKRLQNVLGWANKRLELIGEPITKNQMEHIMFALGHESTNSDNTQNFDFTNVNRVEVIDQKGRSYVNWKDSNKISVSLQDNNKTLKIFIDNIKLV